MSDQDEERFHPTNGRFVGTVGLVLAAVVAGFGIVDGGLLEVPWILPAAGLIGALSWTMLLRPRVSATRDELRLRQPFSTQVLPLAGVGSVSVGRVLECRVRGRRYVSAAVGRTVREVMRDRSQPAGAIAQRSYADFVERRIGELLENARRRAGDADPGEVRRRWAWPEVVGTAGAAVALVLTLLVG